MAYSSDFNDHRLDKCIESQSSTNSQEAFSLDYEYLSSSASNAHIRRLAHTFSNGPYRRYQIFPSYPSPPEHHQHVSSDSSVVSSNEMDGPMGVSILQDDTNEH